MIWWTLQNLAVATLLAGVVHIVCRAGRIGPVGRHTLWLIVLAKLLTPPLVVLHLPWSTNFAVIEAARADVSPVTSVDRTSSQPEASGFVPAGVLNTATVRHKPDAADGFEIRSVPVSDLDTSTVRPNPSTMDGLTATIAAAAGRWLPWFAWIWLAGALAFAFVQGIRIARVVRSLRRAGPADEALAEQTVLLARVLRMRPVPIRVVPSIDSPSIWCVHRAQLLWPAGLAADISDSARRGLLVHELAHVKRRDHWVGWLELAAGCVWWWNPLFWYVRSQLRENAELACDGWVVETLPHGRRAYAEALLAVCAGLPRETAPMPAVGIRSGSRRVLERRLVMIMRERVPLRLSRAGLASAAMLALATLPAWAQTVVNEVIQVERAPAVAAATIPQPVPVAPRVTGAQQNSPREAIPDDARTLLDRFAEQQAGAYREAEEKIARQRHDLIGKLQAIQDTYTKAGRLDEAVAVRDSIRRLTRQAAATNRTPGYPFATPAPSPVAMYDTRVVSSGPAPLPQPTLAGLRGRVGQTMTVPVIGSTAGTIWGSDAYTDDSSLAVAAVHAGVVAPGQLGFARVTILPGRDHYEGVTRNGVTSQSFGTWQSSFTLERDPDPAPVIRLGQEDGSGSFLSLQSFRGLQSVSVTIEVVGAPSGSVWGTDMYTDDSSVAGAAVHAGILRPGERGLVKVTILPGQENYAGSDRNGVQSASYGKWDGSFRIERAAATAGAKSPGLLP